MCVCVRERERERERVVGGPCSCIRILCGRRIIQCEVKLFALMSISSACCNCVGTFLDVSLDASCSNILLLPIKNNNCDAILFYTVSKSGVERFIVCQ